MNSTEREPQTKTEEFSELLRCYGDMAYRMAFQITGGREADARDLVQDGFIKIWRFWRFQKPTSFKGWMYRVLHNLYMDALRYKKRRPTVSLDGQAEEGTAWEQNFPDSSPSISEELETHDLQNEVTRALMRLDLEFRTPIMLCDMEGLSYDQIAQVVGCPVGTVRSRIHRGRTQLRVLLGHFAKETK